MICICSQQLSGLASLLASLEVPSIGIPGPLAQLSAMLSASMSAQLGAGAGVGLDASAMAAVSAAASAALAVQAGLGIDLTMPSAQMELNATIAALNANASAFLALGGLDPAPWLALSLLASLAIKCELGFGVGLFSAGAAAALSAALGAGASASSSLFASASASASMSAMASAMGVADLSASGGMAAFAAKLSLLASLSIPGIDVSLGVLGAPLAILGAIANISVGLGLNALSPGFADSALSLTAGLSAFADLSLPVGLAASLSAAAMAAASAGASASLDASMLAGFEAPGLGGLTAIASFVASCNAAGFAVGMSGPCGGGCPMSF